ncbi:MAG TPA: RepB family plasmid replication initiator protein, partial [Aquificaceae bacterium]|nr:RepB family plasmid replication initiator protein [Aquificaceae bacterium]
MTTGLELLKQYQSIGKRRLKIEELRSMLGIREGEYKLYGDFKRR